MSLSIFSVDIKIFLCYNNMAKIPNDPSKWRALKVSVKNMILKKKENYMDKQTSSVIKGVAVLMMLFHHLFRLEKQFGKYDVSFAPFKQYQIMNIAVAFKICVGIFAFISGYGLFLSYRRFEKKNGSGGAFRWSAARYIKTMSGFWFVFVISAAYCQHADGLTFQKYFEDRDTVTGAFYMLLDFLGVSHLFGTPSLSGSWWYMSAAAVYIFLTPLLYGFQKKYGFASAFACAVIIPRLFQIKKLDGTNSILGFLFVFLLGMAFASGNIVDRWVKCGLFAKPYMKAVKLAGEAVIIYALYKLYINLSEVKFWELLWGIIPAAAVLFIAEFIATVPLLSDALGFLGKHSMNIFLTHLFIKTAYYKDFIYGQGHFLRIFAVLLVCSLAVSVVLELIKKLIRYGKLTNWAADKVMNAGIGKSETENEITRETEKNQEKTSV